MTRRQIDEARERRLWIRDVIMPTITFIGGVMYFVPEAREAVVKVAQNLKRKFDDLRKK